MADKLEPKGTEAGGGFNGATSWSTALPGRQQVPNPAQTSGAERGNPVSSPVKGRRPVRRADGGAGLGCRKKQRPPCNRADTGFNVTRHESEPTSDGCLFARGYGEHLKREEQREVEVVRPPAGAAPPLASPELVPSMLVSQRLFRKGSRVGLRSAFEVLEPYAGKLARTVLRGAGGP